jgi:hypothetical protein
MANWKTLRLNLIGVSPLLCHNGSLADPLSDGAKKLKAMTGKKKKTDADHAEIARIEWTYGLYLDGGIPVIPGEIIEAAIMSGAKKQKQGKTAKAAIICSGNYPIQNGGADLSDLDGLWQNKDYRLSVTVRNQMSRIVRTRPMFKEWSLRDVEISYDDEKLNESEVMQALKDEMAIGDWRPKYGRFSVEKV